MCYKVTISKKAREDLVKLTTYLAVDCAVPITAERQRNRILEGIESLKQFPYRCKCFLTKEKFQGIEFRTLILDPWQVIFVIDEKSKTVDIVRILSSRMDLPSHLQKQFSLRP
ncbi:type II toxin-antitoxin system RelE/ParE family toxin [uncultured Turicimonas sp.]|uniref:type II toxin-antitoxin system RelE/ParE family toxin n=1 Tax=uncultured Turicimonas sp. TaxID=1918607 RepID=UPI0028050B7D|nr:type II toxin-antitoxin system RelE/ParE family toxin [uncultured Turicimonas sp.]